MALPQEQARRELGELFHGAVTDHADVMAECEAYVGREIAYHGSGLSILRLYNLPPSSLFYKYEAFLLSRPSGLRAKLSVFTLETIRELRKEIQRQQQASAVVGVKGTPGSHSGSDEVTPKGGVGVRKGKGNMSDLGGLCVKS